jgi:predicted metal-dependent HD superfamily phosphohydrolase
MPHVEKLLSTSWCRFWTDLGAAGNGADMYEDIVSRYREPWRKYHTLEHLCECIETFEPVAHLAAHPAAVEAALWFHDAVYEPSRTDNEERSARLAEHVLYAAGVLPDAVDHVTRLVLATRHTALPHGPDEQLLVDIDLAILGASEPRFAEYERQVRDEYAFVPKPQFYEKRRAILQSFLARPQLYSTRHFANLLERRARMNLARAAEASQL